jgi:methylmalonyl-CoA mutase N-terminal domain/subunit
VILSVHVGVHGYDLGVASTVQNGCQRGSIRKRGNSYQVRVYAGVDPVIGRANYLTASTRSQKEADKALRRLATEIEEQRNARTKATLANAVDAWLRVHEAEANTLRGYEANARRHIKPTLGQVPLGKNRRATA